MRDCWLTDGKYLFAVTVAVQVMQFILPMIFVCTAKRTGSGLKVQALSANPAVVTCLANDVGYDHIFSEQLAVLAETGDLLIVLSEVVIHQISCAY